MEYFEKRILCEFPRRNLQIETVPANLFVWHLQIYTEICSFYGRFSSTLQTIRVYFAAFCGYLKFYSYLVFFRDHRGENFYKLLPNFIANLQHYSIVTSPCTMK